MLGNGSVGNWSADWAPKMVANTTTTLGRDENLATVEVAVMATIFSLAVFGNCTVLFILSRKKKLSRMNLLIVHLSLADLFVAFFECLSQMIWDITYRFQGDDFLCRGVKFFQLVAIYASSYVLLTTAIDRYYAICFPLSSPKFTPRRINLMVLAAWLLSLLCATPQIFIFAMREVAPGTGVYDCWGVFEPLWSLPVYVTWFASSVFIVPFFILTFTYGRICFVVWKSVKFKEANLIRNTGSMAASSKSPNLIRDTGSLISCKSQNSVIINGKLQHRISSNDVVKGSAGRSPMTSSSPLKGRANHKALSKAKIKTVKLTLTVIICYVICWSPFFISQMWAAWDEGAPFTSKWNYDFPMRSLY